jgi:hypothetical protein
MSEEEYPEYVEEKRQIPMTEIQQDVGEYMKLAKESLLNAHTPVMPMPVQVKLLGQTNFNFTLCGYSLSVNFNFVKQI